MPYDGLIMATGATARRLLDQDDHDHVLELRTIDDALTLRNRISDGGRRVIVIGAGFAALFGREGRLRAVLGLNMPRHVMPFRKPLTESISWDDALAHAASL